MPFDARKFEDTLFTLLDTNNHTTSAAPAAAAAPHLGSGSDLRGTTFEQDYADKARRWRYTKDRVGLPRASSTQPPPPRKAGLDLSASQKSVSAPQDGQVHRMFESLARVHSAGAVSVLPPFTVSVPPSTTISCPVTSVSPGPRPKGYTSPVPIIIACAGEITSAPASNPISVSGANARFRCMATCLP